MSINFQCAGCGKSFRASAEHAGKSMKCPDCGTVTRIPAASRAAVQSPATVGISGSRRTSAAARPASSPSRPPAPRTLPSAPEPELALCPHCHFECRIRPEWRGKKLQCPTCKTQFVVPLIGQRPVAPPPAFHTDDGFITDDPVELDRAPADPYGLDLVDDGPAAPVMQPPRRSFRRKKKGAFYGSGYGEWVRGPGLWILDGVGLAILVLVMALGLSALLGSSAQAGASILQFFIGFSIGFAIVVAVAALILLGACSILGEDPPSFGRCMGIVFLIWESQFVAGMVVGGVMRSMAGDNPDVSLIILVLVINIVVGFATAGWVLTVTLDVSFGKALVIWFVEFVIGCLVIFMFACLFALLLPGLQLARLGAQGSSAGTNQPSPSSPFNTPASPGARSPSVPLPGAQLPTPPAASQRGQKKPSIVLSNARMWRSTQGITETVFTVDFRIEGADITPGDTYNWVIKPAKGIGASTMVFWIAETTQGSPRSMGSQGTLSGSIHLMDPNTAGTVETYIEAEGWNLSGVGPSGRVREKVSNTITFQLVSDPSPHSDPFPGSGGPGGLPGGRGGLPGGSPGQPGGFPGGSPGGPPSGPPGGFPPGGPGRLPGRR